MMRSNNKRLWKLGITLESVSQGRLSLCPELKKLLVGCKKMRKFEIEMTEAGTYTLQPYISFPESMSPTLVRKIEYVLNFVSTKGNMGGARISKLLVYREQINDWLKTIAFEGWVVPVYLFGYQVDARYKQRMVDALEIIEEELCALYVVQEVLFGYSESQFPESKTEDIPNEDSFNPAQLKVLDSATSEAVERMKGYVRDCEECLLSIKAASAMAPLKEKSKWQMCLKCYERYIDIHELLTRALIRGDVSVTLVNRFLDYFSEKTTTLDQIRDPLWYLRSEQFVITSIFPLDRLDSVEAFAEYQAAYTRLYSGRGPSDGRARVVEATVRLLRQQFVYVTDEADFSCLLQLSGEFRWSPHVMLSSMIPTIDVWRIRLRACQRGLDSVHVLQD